jgi:hypothetical protein
LQQSLGAAAYRDVWSAAGSSAEINMILGQHQVPCQLWFLTVNFNDLSSECLELLCGLRIEDKGLLTELCKQAS